MQNVQMKKQVQSLRKEGAANSSQFEKKTNNKTCYNCRDTTNTF
jgi:hypothetical protein